MAALKLSCMAMALMALLSLAICSTHSVHSSMPEPENAGEPDPGKASVDPDLVWEANIHGGGGGWGGGSPGSVGGYGHGSGSSGGGGGGGGWSRGDTPGYGGGSGYGSGGGSNGGGGYGYGGGADVPPKFEINPECPYYCKPVACDNPDGCPGFAVYLGHYHHG